MENSSRYSASPRRGDEVDHGGKVSFWISEGEGVEKCGFVQNMYMCVWGCCSCTRVVFIE